MPKVYTTVQNRESGVVHLKDSIFHEELTACGHSWVQFSAWVNGHGTADKITCGNCLRMLATTSDEGGGEHMHVRPHKLPETPKLTVDAIIHVFDKIVLIKRKFPPLGYAFPGGFVDIGETCEQAVIREVREEIGLVCKIQGALGIYSDPNRDKRGHIVSIAYILTAPKGSIPVAADDAKEAFLVTPYEASHKTLIADHGQMLIDFYHQYWDKWTTIRE